MHAGLDALNKSLACVLFCHKKVSLYYIHNQNEGWTVMTKLVYNLKIEKFGPTLKLVECILNQKS